MNFGFNFGMLGGGNIGTPPIIQGDFIWYSLDPETGFITGTDGTRYINDEGNTIMVPPANHPEPYGTKNGTMYSGRSYTLSGDGKLDVPINATLGAEFNPDSECTDIVDYAAYNGDISSDGNYLTLTKTDSDGGAGLNTASNLGIAGSYASVIIDIISFPNRGYFTFQLIDENLQWITSFPLKIGRNVFTIDPNEYPTFDRIRISHNDMLVGETFVVDTISCKEIQSVSGAIVYWDESLKEFVQVTADGAGSSIELVTNGDFSDGLNNWGNEWGPAQYFVEDGKLKSVGTGDSRQNGAILNIFTAPQKRYRTSVTGLTSTSTANTHRGAFIDGNNVTVQTFSSNNGEEQSAIVNTDISKIQNFTFMMDGDIGYLDKISLKEALPLSTFYTLSDGTYGAIAVLWGGEFNQADLNALKENPELLIRWGLGEDVLSIPKSVDDKVYPAMENVGPYVLELNYQESLFTINIKGDTSGVGNTIDLSGNIATIHGESPTDEDWKPRSFVANENLKKCRMVSSIEVTNGSIYLHRILGGYNYDIDKILPVGTHNFSVINSANEYNQYILDFNGQIETIYDLTTEINVYKILSPMIEIEGTYTRNVRKQYGIQSVRFELNDANVPTAFINNHQIKFHGQGDHIDTGINIDGSQTDFTVMLAFTNRERLTGESQKLVQTPGDAGNALHLVQNESAADNVFNAKIGQWSQTMDLNNGNPIHAMVGVFNHSTSQLQIAVDGEPLSAPFDIVFDGPTGEITIGAWPSGAGGCTHYIGEGILSATMESEDAWFAFWDRVRLAVCDKPDGEYIVNWTFDCDRAGWENINTTPTYSNGNVDILRQGSGSRVQQTVYMEAGNYDIEVEVVSTGGSGFVFMNPAGNEGNYPLDYLDPGVHTKTVTIGTSEDYNWGVGANNPLNSHTVFSYLSVKASAEYLYNYSFDLGTDYWTYDSKYPAEITDNGDGSVHLKTLSNFGSLVPTILPTDHAEWVCEVEFINQVGSGKISFRDVNDVWHSTATLGDGVHSATYTGVVKELHVGADGDSSYEADYLYISLKKTVTLDMDGDGKPDKLLYHDNKITITKDEDSINIDTNNDGIIDAQINTKEQ